MKNGFYRNFCLLTAIVCFILTLNANAIEPEADQSSHPSCPFCGMDRVKFAHSRMLIVYDDGSTVGTCSLHCAAMDLALKIDRTPVEIKVGDYNTKQLIDAESALWVTGGDKMGVMTKRAKWAFADESDAKIFISTHGGVATAFSGAIKAAFEDMYEDVNMIRAKRKKR